MVHWCKQVLLIYLVHVNGPKLGIIQVVVYI